MNDKLSKKVWAAIIFASMVVGLGTGVGVGMWDMKRTSPNSQSTNTGQPPGR
jgi:hypothetical protein